MLPNKKLKAPLLSEALLNVTLAAPTILGFAEVGQLLTASVALLSGAPITSYAWQWYGNGSSISGATSQIYVVALADLGHTLTVKATVQNALGSVTSGASAATSAVLSRMGLLPLLGVPFSPLPYKDPSNYDNAFLPHIIQGPIGSLLGVPFNPSVYFDTSRHYKNAFLPNLIQGFIGSSLGTPIFKPGFYAD